MEPWMDRLLFLVVGAGVTLLTQYLTNRQSAQVSVALARDERRFELGKTAYKEANAALDVASQYVQNLRAGMPLTPMDAGDVLRRFSIPLLDARIVFGLPSSDDLKQVVLDEAIFDVRWAVGKPEFVSAAEHLETLIHEQREEIEDAWRRTIEGGDTIPLRTLSQSFSTRVGLWLRNGNVWAAIFIIALILVIVMNGRDEVRRYNACVLERSKAECDDIFEYNVPPERRP